MSTDTVAAGVVSPAVPNPNASLAARLEAALQHKLQIPVLGLGTPQTAAPEDEDPDAGPEEDFTDINLQVETIRLFRQTRRLLSKVLHDKLTPVNQKAGVVSSLNGLLKALANQQTDIYNAERLKRFESVVIRMVRDLPEDVQARFLDDYEREVNVR